MKRNQTQTGWTEHRKGWFSAEISELLGTGEYTPGALAMVKLPDGRTVAMSTFQTIRDREGDITNWAFTEENQRFDILND